MNFVSARPREGDALYKLYEKITLNRQLNILVSCIELLDMEMQMDRSMSFEASNGTKVFLVHGWNEAVREAGAWKMELAREIRAAGLPIDPNKLV
jgi:hypothetical protein